MSTTVKYEGQKPGTGKHNFKNMFKNLRKLEGDYLDTSFNSGWSLDLLAWDQKSGNRDPPGHP